MWSPNGRKGTRSTRTRSNLPLSHLVSCSCRAGPPSAVARPLLLPALCCCPPSAPVYAIAVARPLHLSTHWCGPPSAAVYPQSLSLSESHQFWLISYSPDNTYLPGQPPPNLIARLICLQSTVLTSWLLTAKCIDFLLCSIVQYFSCLLTHPNTPTHHTHTYTPTYPPPQETYLLSATSSVTCLLHWKTQRKRTPSQSCSICTGLNICTKRALKK